MQFSHSVGDGSQAETDTFAEVPPVFQCSYSKVQCIARLFSGMFSRYNKALVKKEYFSFFSFSVFQIQIFLGLCCKLSKNNLLEKMGKKKRHYY